MLPPDHPHTRRVLGEDSGNRNQDATSSKKLRDFNKDIRDRENWRPHQLTSTKSFVGDLISLSPKKSRKEDDRLMKKSKSSTSLTALLSRPRSSKSKKKEDMHPISNQENQRPPAMTEIAPPPIWAQFATQAVSIPGAPVKVPLNDHITVTEEFKRYTPQACSPSKQRGFERPTLHGRSDTKPRPKSECIIPRHTKESFTETLSDLRNCARTEEQMKRKGILQQNNVGHGNAMPATLSDQGYCKEQRESKVDNPAVRDPTASKRGSRVMAAIAAFNGKSKELPKQPLEDVNNTEQDPQAIESAFEILLVSIEIDGLRLWLTFNQDARNVPQNTRDKMRSLDTNIKADFINKDRFGSGSASSTEGLSLQHSRPNTGKGSNPDNGATQTMDGEAADETTVEGPRKARPRSRTFTWSKGDQSPSKKHKTERPASHLRNKSGGLTPSGSLTSMTSAGAAQGSTFLSKSNRPSVPEDYLMYLKKVREPEKVEVGKVHKLRQLLRNETVGWVHAFITQGGLTELVELLYRIIKVEWRIEHEDNLLHETLLCLKALSTTSSAIEQISQMQFTLFPKLLGMLFDKEKKGPSEYTTRAIIIILISTYLSDSASVDLNTRARTILSYLRDPAPAEDAEAPPEFITTIWHPRPYRIWNKELDNVTKEVFWIFLHHTNIIPYPEIPSNATSYTTRHSPKEHPPVPAQPYIGGVEWDATNYFTAHIDLLNGLIAALPTKGERNSLRQELKDSGFEKIMGVSLRTCKEALYGRVHEALSTWVGAAKEDDWPYQDVRYGPKLDEKKMASPEKSPKKKDQPPQLDMPRLRLGEGDGAPKVGMPRLDLGVGIGIGDGRGTMNDGGWL